MANVLGIGGIFFRSPDPAALMVWYERWLKIPIESGGSAAFQPAAVPAGGCAVWAPFPADTAYFGSGKQAFMFNLIVDDLDAALAQVRDGGAEIVGGIENYDYGRFGWFVDPDGNKVELWQPKKT